MHPSHRGTSYVPGVTKRKKEELKKKQEMEEKAKAMGEKKKRGLEEEGPRVPKDYEFKEIDF